MKKKNRRKHAASRSKARDGFSRAMILQGKNQYRIQLLDYDAGGIGVSVSDEVAIQLDLAEGQVVTVQFFLGGIRHNDAFTIQSINGNRVGLLYVNKKCMSPQNRLMMSQNSRR